MSNSNRACDMCGRSAPEIQLSREHVFAQVLRDSVDDSNTHTFASGVGGDIAGMKFTEETRPTNLMDVTVRSVCTDCNGGWMSRLESRAATVLLSLIAGASSVTADEADTVRLWAAKTAAVIQMSAARGREDAPVDEVDRNTIRKGSVPEAWVITLTRLDDTWRHHRHRGYAPIPLNRLVDGQMIVERYHITTIELGQMLLMVIGGPPDSDASADIGLLAVRHLWEVVPAIYPLIAGEPAELMTWQLPSIEILKALTLRFSRLLLQEDQ